MMAARMISIVMPCFNAARFVGEAIRSACAQTYADLEVICVDDGSTDGSATIIEALARRDPRVRPILLRGNAGSSAARNLGIAQARGEWVAPLDADDSFAPGRLARLAAAASEHRADMVADNLRLVAFPGGADRGLACRFVRDRAVTLDLERYLALSTLAMPGYGPGYLKPMIRTEFLRRHEIGYGTAWRCCHDFALYLDCLLAGARFAVLPDGLYRYRLVPGSLSRSGTAALGEIVAQAEFYLARAAPPLSPSARAALAERRASALRVARVAELKLALIGRGWRKAARALSDPRPLADAMWFVLTHGFRPHAGVRPWQTL
jgi:glycosyltransferase involved in cell wall biosynthesis